MEVPGGSRWSPDRRRVTRTRAALDHIAIVRKPAYIGAEVAAVRSAEDTRGLPLLTRVALMMRR
jgi:phage head maturation protease